MAKYPSKILAIDPGLRYMGYALMDDGNLLYYGVKVIDKSASPHATLTEGRKTILRLINDFKPEILVYEQSFFKNNKTAALLNVLVSEIKAIGKRKKLTAISVAPSKLKKRICGTGRATKQEVACVVISKYPKLKVYLPQAQKWKERYWYNLFDAVALAILAYENAELN